MQKVFRKTCDSSDKSDYASLDRPNEQFILAAYPLNLTIGYYKSVLGQSEFDEKRSVSLPLSGGVTRLAHHTTSALTDYFTTPDTIFQATLPILTDKINEEFVYIKLEGAWTDKKQPPSFRLVKEKKKLVVTILSGNCWQDVQRFAESIRLVYMSCFDTHWLVIDCVHEYIKCAAKTVTSETELVAFLQHPTSLPMQVLLRGQRDKYDGGVQSQSMALIRNQKVELLHYVLLCLQDDSLLLAFQEPE